MSSAERSLVSENPRPAGALVQARRSRERHMDQQQGWTVEAIQRLTEMARERIPVATMSLALKRPIESVRAKLSELGITPVET